MQRFPFIHATFSILRHDSLDAREKAALAQASTWIYKIMNMDTDSTDPPERG
jgi:hypothetical protein